MRIPLICLLAASCAAPAGHEAPPPPGLAVLATVTASRDGAPFGELSTTLWKGREERLELPGPAPAADQIGHGLELALTGNFNRAGEFWGELSAAEFDRTGDGGRTRYVGIPQRERLDPSVVRAWTVEVPGRDGPYLVRVEMAYDAWTITELARPRFLHRPKYLR